MCFMKGSLREGAPAKRVREPARHRQSTCKKASQVVKSKNFKVTQAPSVTRMRATFSSADSVQNGSGVINAIHYRSAASLPLGGRLI